MSKFNSLKTQLSAKGFDEKAPAVGTTLADDMLDHVSGGARAVWLRIWLRVIIVRW